MSKKLDWSKCKKRKPLCNIQSEKKITDKWRPYRNGEFWIGLHHAERYYPNRNNPPENGLCFNAKSGFFEVRKKGMLLSQIAWRQSWRKLAWWGKENGIET